jgi:hypothetical protein
MMIPWDLKTQDEQKAYVFLRGRVPPTNKVRERKYLPEGGAFELDARQALIRVLRSDQPLNPILRKSLAELFEVKSTICERRLVFLPRTRANPFRKLDISEFFKRRLEELAGRPKARSNAASDTAKHFGMSKQKMYDHLDPDLKRQHAGRKKSPPAAGKG